MSLEIRHVTAKKDLKKFVMFPYELYKNDPVWVPPLIVEEKKKFVPKSNPYLKRCDYALFLLFDNGEVAGRISAFVDPVSLECWGEPVALFGSFESYDNQEYADKLIDAAASWARDKGFKKMWGPMRFESQEWGFLAKGFDSPPMIMAPYNPDYYNTQMIKYGMKKIKDLLVYDVDSPAKYVLPERFIRLSEKIGEKYGVKVRPINMKHLKEDVRKIVQVTNESTSNNWGFVPVTPEEADDMAESLRPLVNPDIVMIAEVGDRPIGYLIVLPDVNQLFKDLKGKLFPVGIWRMLFQKNRINQFRVWALGMIPEYQRKAIDTLFYKRLYEVLVPTEPARVEANYILEDNMAMNNPILKMGFKEYKRYRVYELNLSE
ncbi:GNAT family N-acetyltransferase [bacterium]|nr:GNAT family N-acetyltransferase [bacterium]